MRKRVLLIDNEPMTRQKLCKKLERQNYDVRWAAHGQEALHNADFRQTDLLLIDLDVPPAENLGILSRIAELNPVLQVVGMTERTDLPAAALGAGVSVLVEKPVDAPQLFRVIEELLAQTANDHEGVRLVPRGVNNSRHKLRNRCAEARFYSAPYSGVGDQRINLERVRALPTR